MALGATRGNVVSMVLKRAGVMMTLGLVIGGVVAWYASAMVRTFLFETEPNDIRILAAALTTLAGAGLLASAMPAHRAASVDRRPRCDMSRDEEPGLGARGSDLGLGLGTRGFGTRGLGLGSDD